MSDIEAIASRVKESAPFGCYVLKSSTNVRLMREMGPYGVELACYSKRRVCVHGGTWSDRITGRGWTERAAATMLAAATK